MEKMKKTQMNEKTAFFKSNSAVFFVVIMSLMIILRDIVGISLNKYIFVAFCAVFFILSSKQDMLCMVLFTSSLLCGLPGNYIMPIALLLYFVKSKHIEQKQLFFCIFIVSMEVFASVFYPSLKISELLGYVTTLMLFFCLIYDSERYDYKRMINYYTIGVLLTCIVVVVATISKTPTWQDDIASATLRFGEIEHETESALNLTLNANSLAYISIAGIGFCTVLLRCSKFSKAFLISELVIFAITGLLTLSRTWVLVVVMLALLYILSTDMSAKGFFQTFFGIALVVLVGYFVLRQFPSIFDGLIERFGRSDVATGNGRYEITDKYLEVFGNDLRITLFGSGVTQYRSVMGMDVTGSLHNSLVQILVCYGLVGTVIFVYGWLSTAVKAFGKVKLLYWIPFICILIFSVSLQMINPWYLIYPHLIALYAIKIGYIGENTKHNLLEKEI